jgi:hypothetical protein
LSLSQPLSLLSPWSFGTSCPEVADEGVGLAPSANLGRFPKRIAKLSSRALTILAAGMDAVLYASLLPQI